MAANHIHISIMPLIIAPFVTIYVKNALSKAMITALVALIQVFILKRFSTILAFVRMDIFRMPKLFANVI